MNSILPMPANLSAHESGRLPRMPKPAARALFVGPEHRSDPIRDALRAQLGSRVFATHDWSELWLLSTQEPFCLAVLHHTLSDFDLEAATRIVRQRWPKARILLVRTKVEFLDDRLYDHRIAPSLFTGALHKTVQQLLSARCD